MRIHELAKELNIDSKELIKKLKALNFPVKNHMSSVDEDTAEIIKQEVKELDRKEIEENVIEVSFPITIKDLAVKLGKKPSQLLTDLVKKGKFLTINQNIDEKFAREIAYDYKVNLKEKLSKEEEILKVESKHLEKSAPIVTLMGHIDHGKTSILDYIIENPNEYPKNGFHNIPLIYLAKRWLYYYYPLMLYGDKGIKQGSTQIAFAKQFREFAKKEHNPKIPYFDAIAIIKIRDSIETNQLISENLVRLLIKIRGRIIEQPLQFIKIGGDNPSAGRKVGNSETKESHFNLFGLMNSELSGTDATDYDKIRSISKSWKGDKSSMNWLDLERQETCTIKMGHYTYHELSKFRFYIKDAILKRWIEFSVDKYL